MIRQSTDMIQVQETTAFIQQFFSPQYVHIGASQSITCNHKDLLVVCLYITHDIFL